MEHVPLEETWEAMENLVDLGLVKNIGVSNMNVYEMGLIMNMAKKPIAVNQLEIQPYFQRRNIVNFCQNNNIVVTGHTSLGGGANHWVDFHPPKVLEDKVITRIAKETGKSNA